MRASGVGFAPVRASAVRIDDVVPPSAPICMLKADVEGYEPQVMQTARRLLSSLKVHDAVVEGRALAEGLTILEEGIAHAEAALKVAYSPETTKEATEDLDRLLRMSEAVRERMQAEAEGRAEPLPSLADLPSERERREAEEDDDAPPADVSDAPPPVATD